VFGGSLSGAHAQKICKVTATIYQNKINKFVFSSSTMTRRSTVNVMRSDDGPGHDGWSPDHRVERLWRSSDPGGRGVSGWIRGHIPGRVTALHVTAHYNSTRPVSSSLHEAERPRCDLQRVVASTPDTA